MSDDLIVWLRGVLDEDERRAQGMVSLVDSQAVTGYSAALWRGQAADIAAKRAILDLHRFPAEDYDDEAGGFLHCQVCEWQLQTLADPPPSYPCPTVRLFASAYAHQPGYRDEWAPDYLTAAKNG